MKDYLILIKGKMEFDYAAENMPKRIEEFREWVATIGDKFIAGQQLEESGAHLKNSETVLVDGPFLESKEIIAGYIMIRAMDLEEAIAIAKSSPFMRHFELIVRPLNGYM